MPDQPDDPLDFDAPRDPSLTPEEIADTEKWLAENNVKTAHFTGVAVKDDDAGWVFYPYPWHTTN